MAERLSVAQDVEGSIPSSRPNLRTYPNPAAEHPLVPLTHTGIHDPQPSPDSALSAPDPASSSIAASPVTASPIAVSSPGWFTPFVPRRGLSNGHLQTILGNFLPRPPFLLHPAAETVLVDARDGSRVLCHCHWQPEPSACLTVILVHGLEGSSDSRYIQGIAARAWAANANVIRMNMRNCGGTDALTPTLYHSGLSGDVGAVINHFAYRHQLSRIALVGYSMGGNMVLKLAGEWGSRSPLCAVVAVSPAADLSVSSDALHRPINRLYEIHFLRRLVARFHRKAALYPSIYRTSNVGPIRSIREFDDKVIATYCGFASAEDYYQRATAARVIRDIAVPTLVIHAADDPFIRILPETRADYLANPFIKLVETTHGGHCAFLSSDSGEEIHWAEATVIRFLQSLQQHADPTPHAS